MYVCVYVCDSVENIQLHISPKLIKIDKLTKFYTQYQISVYIIFSGLDKNRKKGSGVKRTGSEYLKNGSNNFLETLYINTFLHIFRMYVFQYQSISAENLMEVPIWQSNFRSRMRAYKRKKKICSNDFLETPNISSILDVFSNVLVVYSRKVNGCPNLEAKLF